MQSSLLAAAASAMPRHEHARLPIRMLALGDSYTIGEGVSEAGRWPEQLAALLRAHDISCAMPMIIATTGWTGDELMAALDEQQPSNDFDFVTLLIGVNNQYRGQSFEQFQPQLEELLERAVKYAGGNKKRVLVLSIPNWGVTPFARASGRDLEQITRAIHHYNKCSQALVEAQAIAYLDITDLTEEAAVKPELLTDDGLHPSAVDYGRWAQRALPIVLSMLRFREHSR
jgi:lysophospholipase L1-like esterase